MAPGLCSGCQKKQGEFQCPLCQAAELDGGYFCSQECFAKNFVGHRDTVHGSGTVRAKRTAAEKTTEAAAETRKKTDRKRSLTDTQTLTVKAAAQDEAANAEDLMPKDDDFSDDEERDAYTAALKKELEKRTPLPIWPVWPGVDALGNALHVEAKKPVAKGAAFMTTPAVVFDAAATGSIEVRCPAGCSLHHAALFAAQAAADFSALYRDKTARVVIVAGSQPSAHAVAWAARCRRTPAALIVSLHDERLLADQLAQDFVPTEQRIVIASQAALASHHLVDEADDVANATAAKRPTGGDAAPAVSQLAAVGGPSLLITLPDVTEHEFLQPLGTRAVFILSAEAAAAAPAAATVAAKPSASPAKGKGAKQPAPAPSPVALQQPTIVVPDARTVVAAPLDTAAHTPKANADYDNKLSHLIVLKGDMTAAINHITRIYNGSKSRCEHVLAATLLSDWGAQSSRHAHHKLAVLLRLLVEASIKMATSTKVKDPQSLAHIAARCVVRAVKHLEPIDEASRKARGQSVEDVFLDATIAYCFSHIPKSITDELAESWGLSTLGVIGNGALGHADRLRAVAMHRLRALYAPRLGTTGATFIGMLHHCIADASLRHALSVNDVRDATVWDWVCAPLGDLHEFLLAAQLVHRPEDMTSTSGYTRTGAKVSKTQRNKATEALSADFVTETTVVAPHPTAKCPKIKRLEWPVRGARDRRRKLMRAAALDELLSAMPSSKNVPIYLGDIGNLIGKWTTFNARHNGYLPITLQAFIEEHPEEFRIVGNVVTRVKDSVTQQIKLRFDNDEHEDDSDDERRKNKKHRSEKFKISKEEIRTRRGAKLAQQKLFDEKPNMPRRSIKKKLKHLRNQARFNKNHKQIDASARVPGYVKPTPKKLSGRGKKKNARLVKR